MIIQLTSAAQERLDDILSGNDKDAIRLSVNNKGCSGHSYNFAFDDSIQKGDEVIELSRGKLIVDGRSLLFIFGTEIDYRKDKLAARFVFRNPNAKMMCGCGESFAT